MSAKCSQKLISILLISCTALFVDLLVKAQENKTSARKLDEFGDIEISDLSARLDYFDIELQKTPGANGFIMVYRSRRDLPGLNTRLLSLMKHYLVNNRGIPPERLKTVDGGEASCLAQELWIVPPGTAPTPRTDAYSREFIDIESVRKFDEYYYGGYAGELYDVTEFGSSLEAFAEALRKEPRAQAHIIAYSQYYIEKWEQLDTVRNKSKSGQRVYLDPPATASRMLRELKAELSATHRIASNRIKVINGGYRKRRYVELWIVPRGEHPPIPTPNAFPPKRSTRR